MADVDRRGGLQPIWSGAFCRPGHDLTRHHQPVAAAVLGGVERAVGGCHQRITVGRGLGWKPRRGADAYRDEPRRQILRMQHGEVAQCAANFLADSGAATRVDVRQQHREFLAAVARRKIGRALGMGGQN